LPTTITLRQLAALIGERPADPQNAGPVLDDAQKPVSLLDLAVLWTGLQIVVPTWSLGALATLVFGLDLAGAFTAIVVGTLIGGALLGAAHVMGQVGVPQMFLARYALGMRGNAILALVNFISTIGWYAANSVIVAIAAVNVLAALGVAKGPASELLVLGAVTLPTVYLAVGPFDTIRRVLRWLVPLLVLSLAPITVYVIGLVSAHSAALGIPTGKAAGGLLPYWTMWWTVVGVVAIGQLATWSTSASDITRFHRFPGRAANRRVVGVVLATCLVVNVWLQTLGAAFAIAAPGADPAVRMAEQSPLLALDALFAMIAGLVSTNFMNIITGSLSAKASWQGGSRLAWTSAIAVVGTLMAAYSLLVTDVVSVFHTFLVVLLIWETPWLAILLTDYFVVRRRRYLPEDIYGLTGRIPAFNRRGVIAYCGGLFCTALFSYTGELAFLGIPLYSPLMARYFDGADFSYIIGFIVSAMLYCAIARPDGDAAGSPSVTIVATTEGEQPIVRTAEPVRPLLTTVVSAVYMVVLSMLYLVLTLAVRVVLRDADAGALRLFPPLLVGCLGLAGGLKLPELVDHLIDRIDDQRLLAEAADTFSRTQSLRAVAAFLTEQAIYRLECTRAWLVLPDGMREAWAAPQPAPSGPLLDRLASATQAAVLMDDHDGAGSAPSWLRDEAVGPWVAAGARVLVPLRTPQTATDEGRLLGVWVVGAPRVGGALSVRRVRLLERIGQSVILHLDHARLAWEHQESLLRANEVLERRVAERTAQLERANAELEEARTLAEAASRVKGEFLTMMSHELRTPLNAVIGYSEGLREVAEEEGRAEYATRLQRIEAAGRHLLALINDVLDLSKVEAGRADLELETFEVHQLVADVAAGGGAVVQQHGNTLTVECRTDAGQMHSDITRLRQVLLNLLSNAGKFTEQGQVVLSAVRLGDRVVFQVRDTGIGMTPEQLDVLFQPFTQAYAANSRHPGGTGLGLALSQRFCHLMGGDITVESALGVGSVFTVSLPADAGAPPAIAATEAP